MFEVTLIPIIVAAITSVILAFVWYSDHLFGRAFKRHLNFTPEQSERGMKRMPLMAFLAFLSSIVAAYVLNYFGIAWGVYDVVGAIELGIWVWLGFVAPPMLGMVLWEMKPLKHFLIVAGYWLFSFIMMAVILVLLAQ
ncbi:MAG: DUF1761 domain-containing protein [Minisyncoccia bacterium]